MTAFFIPQNLRIDVKVFSATCIHHLNPAAVERLLLAKNFKIMRHL